MWYQVRRIFGHAPTMLSPIAAFRYMLGSDLLAKAYVLNVSGIGGVFLFLCAEFLCADTNRRLICSTDHIYLPGLSRQPPKSKATSVLLATPEDTRMSRCHKNAFIACPYS
jgi:hypothetical protein